MSRAKKLSFAEAIQVLGIDRYSSRETGHTAYKRLAAIHHPDKNQSAGSVDTMARINAAWAMLRTVLKTQEQIDKEAYSGKAGSKAGSKAGTKKRSYKVSDTGLSVELSGEFGAQELIEVLYAIGEKHLHDLGDVIKSPSGLVDVFRAFSTGRRHRVFSVALLDSKNRVIRVEELVSDNPDVRAVATQALLHGASAVYMVVNSVDGSVPKSLNTAQKNKAQQLSDGLAVLGIEFIDYLIVGQKGHYSVKESASIARDTGNTEHKTAA